jgi:hypothetical protein
MAGTGMAFHFLFIRNRATYSFTRHRHGGYTKKAAVTFEEVTAACKFSKVKINFQR